MQIRIQLNKFYKKLTHDEFSIVVKYIKITYSKVRNNGMELCANLLKKLNTIAIISNFLAFFLFLFEKYSFLDPDPDPGVKMNADPDPQPCCESSRIH